MKNEEVRKEEELERARVRVRQEEHQKNFNKGCISCLGSIIILTIVISVFILLFSK